MGINMNINFPIGFHEFHKDEGINFQLNRFYASGIFSYDEIMQIGSRVTDFESWVALFLELAKKSEAEGNMEKCATCYRAAQFYTLGDSRDEQGQLLKISLYEKCFSAYEKAFQKEEDLKYERIPFENTYVPVYIMKHETDAKGTIVMHGGYDSFVQEFLRYVIYLYQAGYNVYMFEGPGQGEVLCRCKLKMTPEWEHCVSAVLDYYKLFDVTLIGISLGGYLATRAAAFEPRVKRLIMYDLIYDFYGALKARMAPAAGKLIDYLTKHPKHFLWKAVENRMNKVYFVKWLFGQGYHIYENVHNPCEYFNCIKQYNTREISGMIWQDTLVLAGASDIYTVFLKEQETALTKAKSVTTRLFTKEEHADHHCQMGNVKLVLDVMINWIEEVSENA